MTTWNKHLLVSDCLKPESVFQWSPIVKINKRLHSLRSLLHFLGLCLTGSLRLALCPQKSYLKRNFSNLGKQIFCTSCRGYGIRELKQPRRRRQQKPHKFAYLTMENSMFARFARFARAFFIFWHFVDVLVLSTTWNDLFCSCVDDVSIWWQMFNFVFIFPKRWFQFNSRIVRTHFSSIMSLNNLKTMAETRSHIFRWHFHFRRHRVCLSSLLTLTYRCRILVLGYRTVCTAAVSLFIEFVEILTLLLTATFLFLLVGQRAHLYAYQSSDSCNGQYHRHVIKAQPYFHETYVEYINKWCDLFYAQTYKLTHRSR